MMLTTSDRETKQFLAMAKAVPDLNRWFKENKRTYEIRQQVSKFTKYNEKLQKNPPIVYGGLDKQKDHQILIFGNLLPDKDSNAQQFEQCILIFVQLLHDKLENQEKYNIIFFNTSIMTASKLNDFKSSLSSLPIQYFQFLQKIFIMHANFIVKTGNYFGGSDVSNFIKKRSKFVDDFIQLHKCNSYKISMLDIIPKYIKSNDTSYKDVIQKHQKIIQKKLQQGILVVESDDDEIDNQQFDKTSKILGLSLQEYEKNHYEIPIIIELLVNYFHQNTAKLQEPGIFRKQAAKYEESILEAACACKKTSFIFKVKDPHIVCGVIKQFFLQLKTPIIPYDVYDMIIKQSNTTWPESPETQIQYCKMILASLPTQNYQILSFMIGFFTKVCKYHEINLMTQYNMAVVFAPAFFRAQKATLSDFMNVGFFVQVTNKLICEYEIFFPQTNYETYITPIKPEQRASMIPFLPDDAANLNDIIDMIGSNEYINLQEQRTILEEEIQEFEQKQNPIGQQKIEQQEQKEQDQNSRSSIGSNDPIDDEVYSD